MTGTWGGRRPARYLEAVKIVAADVLDAKDVRNVSSVSPTMPRSVSRDNRQVAALLQRLTPRRAGGRYEPVALRSPHGDSCADRDEVGRFDAAANCYAYPPDSPGTERCAHPPAIRAGWKYMEYHGVPRITAGCVVHDRVAGGDRCGGGQIDAAKAMDAYLSAGTRKAWSTPSLADPTLAAV